MANAKLKNAGGAAAGFFLMFALLAIPIIFLWGAAEFSVWAMKWIPESVSISVLVCLIILPLSLIKPLQGLICQLYALASFIFGSCLWLYGLAFTYHEWGMLGVFIGVIAFGVGVIFTGTLAAIFSGTWVALGNIAFLFVLYFVSRLLSVWLDYKIDQRSVRQQIKIPSAARRIIREDAPVVTITHESRD